MSIYVMPLSHLDFFNMPTLIPQSSIVTSLHFILMFVMGELIMVEGLRLFLKNIPKQKLDTQACIEKSPGRLARWWVPTPGLRHPGVMLHLTILTE